MKIFRHSGIIALLTAEDLIIKTKLKLILSTLLILLIFTPIVTMAQNDIDFFRDFPDKKTPTADFTYIPKKTGHYSIQDWQAIIDSTWGPGYPSATKLSIFDNVYNIIETDFACFHGLNVNIMDSLRLLYRPEIADSVNPISRGRFVAIMNYFVSAFKESHNWIVYKPVNFNTPLAPGIPLFVVAAWMDNTHFGATLTPLPDSSLLVLKTLPAHPLGLVPGDIVLGYDGIPWKVLYKEILTAQLPFFSVYLLGTTEKARTHDMLKNAGMNWHLFDTLDVVKYSTGDTMHYPTAPLAGQHGNLAGNEQLEIPGVPFPDIDWEGVFNYGNYNLVDYVSWGIVDGTNIGYIYVYAWFTPSQAPGSDISNEFYHAVDSLMNYHKVDGLIFDGRLNFGGGQYDTEDNGFSLLFDSYIETIAFDERYGDPYNHFQMRPHPQWTAAKLSIPGDPNTFFYRPIAVLTGPGAVSQGDIIPLKMTFHPMARLFGKPTSGAFSAVEGFHYPGSGWDMITADANAYLVSNPGNYLSRTESHVDEEVWFTQEDVANGDDTVVEAAMAWITSMIYAHNVKPRSAFITPALDTLNITAKVTNPPNHNLQVAVIINTLDRVFVDSLPMFDDGNHGDSLAGDGIYGCYSNPIPDEDFFSINASVSDLDSNHYHLLTNAARITTAGPVGVHHYEIPQISSNSFQLSLFLENKGQNASVTDIKAEITTTDTIVTTIINTMTPIDSIAPGQFVPGNGVVYVFTQNDPTGLSIDFSASISSEGWEFWSDSFTVVVSGISSQEANIPNKYDLRQNYPNPFNPSTTIEFDLPKNSEVTLKVFNILGEEVAALVSDRLSAGSYSYEWDASNLASGVYLYRLQAGEYVETRKMVLMR